MSKIVTSLRKAAEKHNSQQTAGSPHFQFIEQSLNQRARQSNWQHSWLTWIFVLGVVLAGFAVITYQPEQESGSFSESLPNAETFAIKVEREDKFFNDAERVTNQDTELDLQALGQNASVVTQTASQTMKPPAALEPQEAQQIEDGKNMQESAQQVSVEKALSQEQLTPDRKPAPLPLYRIQVASFQNHKNSEEILKRLRKQAYSAVIVSKALRAKGTWHRVYVGNFQSQREAQSDLAKLQTDYAGSFVIKTQK